MKAIKVGLVGAGYVSAHHLRALKSLDSIEIVGIADLNFERAKSVAARFGVARACPQVEELYALSPEAVHILTPPSSHAALAIQALQAGMHVLVEKPMAESVDECDRMIAAASSAGRTLGVVHSARLDPIVLRGADEVRSGKIGEVISLDFLRSSDYPAWEGGGKLPPHYAKGSYPLQDLGIHALSIAEAFLGEANTAKIAFRSTHSDPNLLFDEWTATVECERGPARLYISWNVRPVRSQIIVHGTRGVMYIDTFLQTCHSTRVLPGPKFGSLVACELRNSAANLYEVPWNVFRFLTGRLAGAPGIQTNIREFYEAVEAGRPVQTSPSEGRRLVALMASVSEEADCKRQEARRVQLMRRQPADVLVTGAGGFLGSALVQRLVGQGAKVRAGVRRMPKIVLAGVDYVVGDLGDAEYVDMLTADVDTVFHVGAAMKGSAVDFTRGTITGTQNMIAGCLRHEVRRAVHVSSLSVLDHAGRRDGTVNEASPLEPHAERRGAYTQTKLEAERLVMNAAKEQGLPAVVIRPGVIFGPGAEASSPAGSFPMFGCWVVVGSGSLPLPLVYVDDVVDGLIQAALRPSLEGTVINLVDGTRITQREYIRASRFARPNVKVVYVPKVVMMMAAVAIEALGRILKRNVPLSRYRIQSLRPLSNIDQTAAKARLGWVPRVGAIEGMRRAFLAN